MLFISLRGFCPENLIQVLIEILSGIFLVVAEALGFSWDDSLVKISLSMCEIHDIIFSCMVAHHLQLPIVLKQERPSLFL